MAQKASFAGVEEGKEDRVPYSGILERLIGNSPLPAEENDATQIDSHFNSPDSFCWLLDVSHHTGDSKQQSCSGRRRSRASDRRLDRLCGHRVSLMGTGSLQRPAPISKRSSRVEKSGI
jgi:hypothetical protein